MINLWELLAAYAACGVLSTTNERATSSVVICTPQVDGLCWSTEVKRGPTRSVDMTAMDRRSMMEGMCGISSD